MGLCPKHFGGHCGLSKRKSCHISIYLNEATFSQSQGFKEKGLNTAVQYSKGWKMDMCWNTIIPQNLESGGGIRCGKLPHSFGCIGCEFAKYSVQLQYKISTYFDGESSLRELPEVPIQFTSVKLCTESVWYLHSIDNVPSSQVSAASTSSFRLHRAMPGKPANSVLHFSTI